ncbi:MAG: N-6 DNA methylase [Planctomycetes bacterium]|nr:N-6 DNA methylase [Planctomycetota bacterium]
MARALKAAAAADAGLTRETLEYMARAPLARRKSLGQFFTPEALRRELLDGLRLPRAARVLDPGCGTGEFLLSAGRRWPDAELFGFEVDAELAAIAGRLVPGADVRVCDALAEPFLPAFDAVIGNPPYFEFKPPLEVRRRYANAISGRPNSYALFVQLGIELLKEGGVLAYVLPPSMNNGAFFSALRRYLLARCRVESLRVLSSTEIFSGASQSVMLLRLRKGERDDGRHVFRRGPFTLLAEAPAELHALYEGCETLTGLGCEVRTGTVVWNQVKDRLTDDPRGAVRLVWARNIGAGRLDFTPRRGKPGYVRGKEPLRGPAIAVNRVTGSAATAVLKAALVPAGMEFVGENHVNVVLPPAGASEAQVRRIVERLRRPRALAAVRRLTGNTQISSLELGQLVPLEALA